MGNGWLFKMKIADPAQVEGLMDEGAYQALIG
jgi:glycine cleavage system H protein